tara:strand:- start:1923 stop:2162 length:240 start_codon:yes stop_codon:yes gene_type:complete
MFDPRQTDKLSEMNDDKLTDRIGELHKRMRHFAQVGNPQAIDQLQVMLAEANEEQQRRWNQSMIKQMDKNQKDKILDKK